MGEPNFGDVHGPRQRECMLLLRCQLCRRPVARNELGYPWLLEDHRGAPGWPEREVTTHPPACETCQPLAAVQCTPNRGKFVSLRVGRVLTDGVYGQLYVPAARSVPNGKPQTFFHGDARLRWMLGAQTAATLFDVTVVDMHTQTPVPREAVRR
ncbi:hypothetical protein ACF09H_29925 [Streptomyces sp. NPDC014983]|uniref:hypothetical protein n=1 Tax=Streptomyces sp. NPDC014983 TaxID=3364933 RepID=UPI0036F6512D